MPGPFLSFAPLFTGVRGIGILRGSPFGDSRKSRFRFLGIPPCEAVAMLLVGRVPCVARREPDVTAFLSRLCSSVCDNRSDRI
jgi:hypothetical protein